MSERRELDPRAWMLWAFAVSLPALIGRNPYPLVASLIVVVAVRIAWSPATPALRSWSGILRLAALFAILGTIFNVLTVRAGDRVIWTVPSAIPILGGNHLTWNALVYGLLTGVALVLLVLVGTTLSALLNWAAIVRLMPNSLTSLAIAGSVAFTLLPQTAAAYSEIREAQAARGHRVRGGRDILPILAPMLALGLERAVTLAETLESRAFGAPATTLRQRDLTARLLGSMGLSLVAVSAYLLIVGRSTIALATCTAALLSIMPVVTLGRRHQIRRTRYRTLAWAPRDTCVALSALAAMVAVFWTTSTHPQMLAYVPYPRLQLPEPPLAVLATQLLLILPAFLDHAQVAP